MYDLIPIVVYSTYITLPCDRDGNIGHLFNIRSIIHHLKETEFDQRTHRSYVIGKYYAYSDAEQLVYLPRHFLSKLKHHLDHCGYRYQEIPGELVDPEVIDIPLNPSWHDKEHQIAPIDFLLRKDSAMRCLTLSTGLGKTYCCIKTIALLRHPALIITDGLVEQWHREIFAQTLLQQEDVYVIQGAKSVKTLFLNPQVRPKIFIAALDTTRMFTSGVVEPYDVLPSWREFLQTYRIGTKAIDEFHLNFLTHTAIDLHCNIAHNLYLSATPYRSGRRSQEIFLLVFPVDIRFGEGNYEKYINVTFYRYSINPVNPYKLCTPKGYSHVKYEQQMLTPIKLKEFVDRVLVPVTQCHFINLRRPEQKLLVFASTVKMCKELQKYMLWYYPSLKVNTFVHKDPESNLHEGEIIISTPGGCGTGKDIAHLRTVVNTCSYNSPPLTDQMRGRLRKLANGDTPEFVDLYNDQISHQVRHYYTRSRLHREKALLYQEFTLNT